MKRLMLEMSSLLNYIRYQFPSILIKHKFLNLDHDKRIIFPGTVSISNQDHINEILKNADKYLNLEFDLLGEKVTFQDKIIWNKDYKSGFSWPNQYYKSYKYNDLDKNNDVKVPWEISRHQFLVTVAQAYYLTQDRKYSDFIKSTIIDWVSINPFAKSINWACTMDVALRSISWIIIIDLIGEKLFKDEAFKEMLIKQLFLHGVFINENFEISDINGNHYLSNASGLYIVGTFLNQRKWINKSKKILEEEIHNQNYEDGVNFEGSVPYHRLITELLFLPFLIGLRTQDLFSKKFKDKLFKLFKYVELYIKPDSYCPIIGDNDNGRAFFLGTEDFNQHEYLLQIASVLFDHEFYCYDASNTFYTNWFFNQDPKTKILAGPIAQILPQAGIAIYKTPTDYLFVESSPLGLGGRGGHGHNDFTSFELTLNKSPLIVDSGCFVYTSNYKQRNKFRSTKYHNVLVINDQEQNDFLSEFNLWQLSNDIEKSEVLVESKPRVRITATHDGFRKINSNLEYSRSFHFAKENTFQLNEKLSNVPPNSQIKLFLHFHQNLEIKKEAKNSLRLTNKHNQSSFDLHIDCPIQFETKVENCNLAYNYGKLVKSNMLSFMVQSAEQVNDLNIHLSIQPREGF